MTSRWLAALALQSIIAVLAPSGGVQAAMAPRALVVLSSIDRLPEASTDTGNYLREVAYPVILLERAGVEVDFVTPDGKPALVRGNEAYGFAPDATANPVLQAFVERHLRGGRVTSTRLPADIDAARYRAMVYTGSLGALIDVATDAGVARIAEAIHANGGWLAAYGHGVAGLLPLRAADGSGWLAGRRLACFSQGEDEAFFFDTLGWQRVLPYHVERRVRDAGAIIVPPAGDAPHVVEDGRVLSSQNASAAEALSRRLAELLSNDATKRG
jgi:putative intracellular protease/amidase